MKKSFALSSILLLLSACATKFSPCEFDLSPPVADEKARVEQLIAQGIAPYCTDDENYLLVERALNVGNTAIVSVLLEYDDAVTRNAGPDGNTLLHTAISSNSLPALNLLLKHGAMLDKENSGGYTPLQLAVQKGRLEMTIHMVEAGSNLSVKTGRNETLMHLAGASGNVALAEYLWSKGGFDINARDNDGNTPLFSAAKHLDMMRLFIGYYLSHPIFTTNAGETLLQRAVQENNIELTQLLLQLGASPAQTDKIGKSPLDKVLEDDNEHLLKILMPTLKEKNSTAAQKYSTKLVEKTREYLINYYATKKQSGYALKEDKGTIIFKETISKEDFLNATPAKLFNYAAVSSDSTPFNLLSEASLDVNAQDELGSTPLHYAAFTSKLDKVKKLVELGAEVSVQDNKGNTPLHLAAQAANLEVMHYLIEQGADKNIRNDEGFSALLKAARYSRDSVLSYNMVEFLKFSRMGKSKIFPFITWGCENPTKKHLSYDAVVMLLDKDNIHEESLAKQTPLLLVAGTGDEYITELLLQKGADINRADKEGRTPVYYAAYMGKPGLVKMLLDKGADMKVVTQLGNTALHATVINFKPDVYDCKKIASHHEAARMLIEHGIDPEVKNNEGKTALDLAKEKGVINNEDLQNVLENAATIADNTSPLSHQEEIKDEEPALQTAP